MKLPLAFCSFVLFLAGCQRPIDVPVPRQKPKHQNFIPVDPATPPSSRVESIENNARQDIAAGIEHALQADAKAVDVEQTQKFVQRVQLTVKRVRRHPTKENLEAAEDAVRNLHTYLTPD